MPVSLRDRHQVKLKVGGHGRHCLPVVRSLECAWALKSRAWLSEQSHWWQATSGSRTPLHWRRHTVSMRHTPHGCRSRQRGSLGVGHRGYTTAHWQPMQAITHVWVMRLEPGPLHGGKETAALSAQQPLNAVAALCHQLMLCGACMGQLSRAHWMNGAQPCRVRHAAHNRRPAERLSGLVSSRPQHSVASIRSRLASWCNGSHSGR